MADPQNESSPHDQNDGKWQDPLEYPSNEETKQRSWLTQSLLFLILFRWAKKFKVTTYMHYSLYMHYRKILLSLFMHVSMLMYIKL